MGWTGPYVCDNFKQDMLAYLSAKTIKLALYTSSAALTNSTTAYSTTNEITGTGYTAGGKTLSGLASTLTSGVCFLDWTDPVWSASSFTAAGALMYNSTDSNKAMLVLDFGGSRLLVSGTFTVVFPAADVTHAIFRLT